MRPRYVAIVWSLLALASRLPAEAPPPSLVVTPEKPAGVYATGEKIVWKVAVLNDPRKTIRQAAYQVKRSGATAVAKGSLSFADGPATVETSIDEPCTLLASVKVDVPDGPALEALGGAAVAPERITPSLPIPNDFDAFWKRKLEDLARVRIDAIIEKAESGRASVDYYKISLGNINGTRVQGQLARPAGDSKRPALLMMQWAGVYPLQKQWVTNYAADGWLVLNIAAHDIAIDQPSAYYQALANGALKGYPAIGNDDREQSYFLRMFLGCCRGVDYLASRPDWDGRTLVVTGGSQGGLQAFATAALHPKVTALMTWMPAGCDNSAPKAGRKYGWPYWLSVQGKDPAKMLETSRYFDGVNFASRITCPALIGLGLVDTTSPPTGVFAAINGMQGPKETVIMPLATHRAEGDTRAAYDTRASEWRKALLKTGAPPAPNP